MERMKKFYYAILWARKPQLHCSRWKFASEVWSSNFKSWTKSHVFKFQLVSMFYQKWMSVKCIKKLQIKKKLAHKSFLFFFMWNTRENIKNFFLCLRIKNETESQLSRRLCEWRINWKNFHRKYYTEKIF